MPISARARSTAASATKRGAIARPRHHAAMPSATASGPQAYTRATPSRVSPNRAVLQIGVLRYSSGSTDAIAFLFFPLWLSMAVGLVAGMDKVVRVATGRSRLRRRAGG